MTDKDIEVIVKPIFTKMFNADFSACEFGIECYKKGMEYQGIKELAIENENLIKQIAYHKNQIEKMKCCENCKHHYFIGDELECRLLDNGINCDDKEKWELAE